MEVKKDEVELFGFDGSVMISLVDFVYLGNICIYVENVFVFFEVVSYLGVEFV